LFKRFSKASKYSSLLAKVITKGVAAFTEQIENIIKPSSDFDNLD
jgi:hypothetical protein